MAYKKTDWRDTLRDAQGNVIQKGTPLNAQALGKIEEGIVQAEQKIDTEIQQVATQLAQNKLKSDIYMIGDSLVRGDELGGMSITPWIKQFTNKTIINKGIFGNWVNMVLARIDADVIAHNPKMCLVLAGTNDINDGSRSLNAMITDATAIADKLLDAKIEPVFISVPPRNDKPQLNATIRKYNTRLSSMCEQKQIKFVDIYSTLCTEDGSMVAENLGTDNLHWSTVGAYKAAKVIKDTIFPDLQNYSSKKLLIVDSLFDNPFLTLTPYTEDSNGQSARFFNRINTANATFSIIDNPKGGKFQSIDKPVTETILRAGLNQSVGGFIVGRKYRTSIDLEFEVTGTPDADTFFRMYVLSKNASNTTLSTDGYTYYVTKTGKIACRFSVEHTIPANKATTTLEIFGNGKSAFNLKIGRPWSEEII